jgi:AraC-like DNA-binding protein
VKAQGLEGLAAKRRDSRYERGQRCGAWAKMRVNQTQEFVIGGYTIGGRTFDALVFGCYSKPNSVSWRNRYNRCPESMIHPELLSRFCHARDLLRDWEDELLSVSAVARISGLTRFHFIRLFKAVFGETSHQYCSRAQIEKARHLLILTDLSDTDVFMAVGFSSLGSFSALFSRRVGISPSGFQRQYRRASAAERQRMFNLSVA